jgi:phosphopantetheinyl transferase (holo-ACP synthase)
VPFTWREIEITGRPKPGVALTGRTEAWAERVAAGEIDLSMTHSKGMAAAVAIVHDVVRV